MRFEAFVAERYLRGKRKSRFVSLITLISIAGVAVGVMALIVVLSVMSGFDEELMNTIVGHHAHLKIICSQPLEDYEAFIKEVEAVCPEIIASAPFTQIECGLKRSGSNSQNFCPALLQGIDLERETHVTSIAENLTSEGGRQLGYGELPKKNEVVLGHILAHKLNALIGDTISAITLIDPRNKPMPFGALPAQSKSLLVSGISQAQNFEFDSVYAYVDIETANRIKRQDGVDGIHVKLTDPWLADRVGRRIRDQFGCRTVTWYESQQAFFEALVQEKVAMFIILLFIVLVAAFNITSTLIMIVMEKKRDIGILRTIGVSSGGIMRIFMLEGLYIGFGGTVSGLLAGILFTYYLNPIAKFIAWLIGMDLFNSVVYYFDHIPVAIIPRDIALIAVSAFVLTFLSTLYPAWSASRLDPVDALRHE